MLGSFQCLSAPDRAAVTALATSFGKACVSAFLGICWAVGLLTRFITHSEDLQAELFYSSLRINHGGSSTILNNEGDCFQMMVLVLPAPVCSIWLQEEQSYRIQALVGS